MTEPRRATIRVVRSGPVSWVTLDRPERLNALNECVREDLHEAVRGFVDDVDCRVVVLRGEGRSFSVGADLKDGMMLPDGWAARRHAAGRWQRLIDDLESLPQATVAVLSGPVIGGGAILAAACDLRIAADDATFAIPEVAIGVPLPWAGLQRLAREIGLARTRDLVMTARTIGANEALDWGLVQRLVPAAELDTAAERLVADLVEMPAVPLAITRSALAAIGRERLATGWADADLVSAALREADTVAAGREYRDRLMKRTSGR